MSRLEADSLTLTCAPAVIADVVRGAVEQLQPAFAEKNQLLDVRADRLPPEIEIDAKRVRQLLTNLLSNASKFTPAGGRILVLARPTADGGVTIAIADTGIGMTHEEIMLALTPFAQVDAQRARSAEGTGLGLPLALGLARLHGGTLHIESQPGAGTTVVVALPRRAAAKPIAQGKAA
jgi:two-component system cell cycle sensor histidine kinase PleC